LCEPWRESGGDHDRNTLPSVGLSPSGLLDEVAQRTERQQGGQVVTGNTTNWLLKTDAGWDPLRRLTSIGVSPVAAPAVMLSTFVTVASAPSVKPAVAP
jgi:hypothetical protein